MGQMLCRGVAGGVGGEWVSCYLVGFSGRRSLAPVPGNQAKDLGLGKIFGGIDPCFLEEFKDRTRCESIPDVNP